MRAPTRLTIVLSMTAALLTGACGEWQPPLPTGPSNFGEAPSNGAIVTGVVNGGAHVNALTAATTSTMTVKVAGTNITAPVSASGRFMLKGVPAGSLTLEFSAANGTATLQLNAVSDGEQIDVNVTVTGASAQLDSAVRIKVDDEVELEGPVEQVSGSCSSLVVVVHGTAVAVNASVGSACSAIRVGVRIKLEGHRSSGATVVVRVEVNGQTVTDDRDDRHGDDDDENEREDEREHDGGGHSGRHVA